MTFRALVVDDDSSFRKVIEIRLRAWNPAIQITSAENLAEAREALETTHQPFALVILDQNLPDGFGWKLLGHAKLAESAVLAVSADNSPELPAQTVKAGAAHFLAKRQVTEPLFIPMVEALVERKRLEREVLQSRLREQRLKTIRMLLGTLRHEINNPLGAVIGGAYLLKTGGELKEDQLEALQLIEASSTRIKHVMKQLCDAAELEEVTKAREQVFQIPGDSKWDNTSED